MKYTKAAIELMVKDLKRLYLIFKYTLAALVIGYYVFAIFMGIGNMIVNIILASIYLIYIIVDFFVSKRRVKRQVKHTYVWAKLIVKAFSLGFTLYAMYTASEAVNPLAIILTGLMIIVWILQFLFELILLVIEMKIQLIYEGIRMDKENAKKPVTTVTNFFKKALGKEVIEKEEPTKVEQRLIDEVENKKKHKKNKSSTN